MSARDELWKAMAAFWNSHDLKQLSGTSFGVLVIRTGGVLLAFLVQIPLTRLLGAEIYGAYVYVLSWVMVAGIIAGFGMDTTFVRYVPTCVVNQDWARLKGLVNFGFGGALTACVLLGMLAYGAHQLSGTHASYYGGYVPVGVALLVVLTTAQLVRAALRGLHRVLLAEIADSVGRPLLILSIFLVLYYFSDVTDAQEILRANVLAAFTLLTVLAAHLWHRLPKPVKRARPDFSDRARWLALALPMILITGMGLLLNRTDIIMLGSIKGPAEAGIYAIGSRFAEFATFGLAAVNTVLAPRISEMYHAAQLDRLQRLLAVAVGFSVVFTLCVVAVLTVLAPFLLTLFGAPFSAAYVPMLILLVGQIINALAGSVGYLTIMTGRQKEAAVILFAALLVNLGGNLALIPPWGLNGAAVATGISAAVWNIALLTRVNKHLNLNPSILALRIR
jgi:O-antigen/teichoic acid export membrane protein